MNKRFRAVLLLTISVAGCGAFTTRGDPPIWTGISNRALNATASCIIAGLNTVEPGHVTHSAQIIEPDRVLEIAPQQTLTIGAEIYFVRLTAISNNSTKIELNSIQTWTSRLQAAIASCVA